MKQNLRLFLLTLLCAVISSAWAETTTDVLDRAFTGVEGNTYSGWSGKEGISGAVYAGQSAGGNESIQLRTTNSNSGIVTTTSGGKAKKITVTWNSNTADGRTLDVYGKNSAYTNAVDLYNSSTQGTKIGSIVCGTSTELTINDDYAYIGLRSYSGAMYLSEVKIDWETGGQTILAPPTFTPNGADFIYCCEVAISAEEGSTIYYTLDGSTPYYNSPIYYNGAKYTGPITLFYNVQTSTQTIKAVAIKDGQSSEVAMANFTQVNPRIDVSSTDNRMSGTAGSQTLTLTPNFNIENATQVEASFKFYDEDGFNQGSNYPDWFSYTLSEDYKTLTFNVAANESEESRMTSFKIFFKITEKGSDRVQDVETSLVKITQGPKPVMVDYELYDGNLTEGDYIIFYEGKALSNTISNNRLQYKNVEPQNDVISTDNEAIVWHIAKSNVDYWTIQNLANGKYAAGTGTKNEIALVEQGTADNNTKWTATKIDDTDGNTYDFVNKKNADAEVNANLRNNGTYGFACYSTSTGGPLTLYKKTEGAAIDLRGKTDPIVFNVLNGFVIGDDYNTYASARLTDRNDNSYRGFNMKNVKSAEGTMAGVELKAGDGSIQLPTILSDNGVRVELAVVKGQVRMNNSNIYVPNPQENIYGGLNFYESEADLTINNQNNEEAVITYLMIIPLTDGGFTDPGLAIDDAEMNVGEEKVLEINTRSEGEVCITTKNYDVAEVRESVGEDGKRVFTVIAKAAGEAEFEANLLSTTDYSGASCKFKVTVAQPATLLYEGFSGVTAAGDNSNSIWPKADELDYKNWYEFNFIYLGGTDYAAENGGCGKMGKSGSAGSMEVQGIDLNGAGVLTFKLKQYGNDTGNLIVTITGADVTGETTITPTTEWAEYSINLTNAGGNVGIIFASTKRLYIDEIKLVRAFSYTISDLASDGTDCYATVSALGNGNWKVKGNVEVSTVIVNNGKLEYPVKAYEGDIIPGDGAYLVKGAAGTYAFAATNEAATITIGGNDNMLLSTGEGNIMTNAPTGAADNDNYFFYKLSLNSQSKPGSVGFYWGDEDGVPFTYKKAHQAYLAVLKTDAANAQGFSFDGTTDIAEVETTNTTDGKVYTISGVRVDSRNLSKGIYIVNGKKVIIK